VVIERPGVAGMASSGERATASHLLHATNAPYYPNQSQQMIYSFSDIPLTAPYRCQ